jgi:suppressor of tumorigenicity protein 13
MEASQIEALKALVGKLEEDPTLAYDPQMSFFKDFVTSWGAKIPSAAKSAAPKTESASQSSPKAAPAPEPAKEEEEEEEPEEEEPDEPEEEDPERLPEDTEPFPEAPTQKKEEDQMTDADFDKIGELKSKAADDVEDGKLADAIEKYTQIMKLGEVTAMLFAKRADLLLKMKRPNACINDCSAAIKINPDSAKAYRLKGKAHRKLGQWEDAHKDLAEGQKLDFDDDLVEVQKFVDAKWKKIAEKQNKKRLRDERIAKKKREADIKAKKTAAQKAYDEAKSAEAAGGFPGGFPGMGGMGGMGGMPGMPAGLDPSMMGALLQDPELLAALQNPKIATAMQEIMSNPANMAKYQDDPDVMELVQKLMGKMGGMGFNPEEMMAGMGGMGGGAGGAGGAPPSGGPTVEEVDENTGVDDID